MVEFPRLLQTVVDTTDVRQLAEFYRLLLGLHYRQGDEMADSGAPDDATWLVLVDSSGHRKLAFQQVQHLRRAEMLGPQLVLDRTDDLHEPLYVFADPSGHPFCIFVA